MSNILRVLLVEDSEDDALLIVRHIQRNGYNVVYERVEDSTTMDELLQKGIWDIIIADYSLPAFNGLAALALLKEKKIDIPLIIVSGTIGENDAVQAMKSGAHDYVMKANLARLIPAIRREMDESEMRRERIRAEEALHESEVRYRGLFEGSKDAIIFSTIDGKFVDVNPAGIELFKFGSKEDLLKADIDEIMIVDAQVSQQKNRLISVEGCIKDFEYKMKRKDGTTAIIMETTMPVNDRHGNVIMYRSILRDITKHKQLEQQFIQSQKMESIGTLAGGIAHDFNNILGIILGYTGLLERKRSKPQEFSYSINAILQAVERGTSLVQQILTFARKTDISFKQMSIGNAANEMITLLKETFPKFITIKGIFPKDVPDIYAEHTQIHQVLLNLCLNARDAMTNGGTLTLKTKVFTNRQLHELFPGAIHEKYVCLSVSDTGEGMDEDTRLRIFDPFFTTKKEGKGTGLGLSVVYGVMQAHNGFIDVESELAHGTTFRLFFPVPEEGIQQIEMQKQQDPHRLEGSETILLVEDEYLIREMLQLTLESKGYKVYPAEDGVAAIQLYQTHAQDIDLVLTDLGLPGMSGVDEFKKLKELNPDVIVVVMSGFLEQDDKYKLFMDGAKAFIQKPFQLDTILITIRDVLDKTQA